MGQGTKNTLKNNSITSYIKKKDIQAKTIWKGDWRGKEFLVIKRTKSMGKEGKGILQHSSASASHWLMFLCSPWVFIYVAKAPPPLSPPNSNLIWEALLNLWAISQASTAQMPYFLGRETSRWLGHLQQCSGMTPCSTWGILYGTRIKSGSAASNSKTYIPD